MSKSERYTAGFTAVEVLITLFVVGFVLASGYQTYALVTDDAAETSHRTEASNYAYEAMRQFEGFATTPCTPITPPTNELPADSTLPNPRSITAAITCPYGTTDNVSLVTVTVTYGPSNEKVVHGIFTK